MLIFKKITASNFLSCGSKPLSIEFDSAKSTLIYGKSGNGKSLWGDALCFVLYNKPYRNINKPQLVNSINQKQCVVELEFTCNSNSYKVIRGIKPAIFEIYENGALLNQDPNIKDYQKVLEQQILKMNYRAFTQTVLIGSGSYIQFMELSAVQRREFIEDLLDIRIFSIMNSLLKDIIKSQKENVKLLDLDIKSVKEKILMQESFISKQEKEREISGTKLKEEKDKILDSSSKIVKRIERISGKVDSLLSKVSNMDSLSETLSELKLTTKTLNRNSEHLLSEKKFYDDTENCPKCKQSITKDHKDSIFLDIDEKIAEISSNLVREAEKIKSLESEYLKLDIISKNIRLKQTIISSMNRTLSTNRKLINSIDSKLLESMTDSVSITEEKEKLKELASYGKEKISEKLKLQEELQYSQAANILLQDSGIKAKIIKQYIPVINKLVNGYLDNLDFFVSFNLDENFNEVVKSRHRDTFTYNSFSEGQRRRIDIALLLTWREVAKLKNSVNCNLLFLDEVLDGNFDTSTLDVVLDMIGELKDTNTVVISHRENIIEKFDRSILVNMKNNFTELILE